MPDYVAMGGFNHETAGHIEKYFMERYTFMDFRGGLFISPTSEWGFGVKILTMTHDIRAGQYTPITLSRPVYVEDYAWIASFSLLYNCRVSHHGIVACEAVVRNMTVEPYTIVAGNPARVIARWDGKEWIKTSTW